MAKCAYLITIFAACYSRDASEGLWRRQPHTERNGNLYPTHGLGPVANYMGINRGDRFDYLVSMSSPEHGLERWREAHVPKDSPKWKENYVCGDVNTSLIKTANGLTITLTHDVVNHSAALLDGQCASLAPRDSSATILHASIWTACNRKSISRSTNSRIKYDPSAVEGTGRTRA